MNSICFKVGGFEGPFIGITCLVVVTIILVYIFIPGADEKGALQLDLRGFLHRSVHAKLN